MEERRTERQLWFLSLPAFVCSSQMMMMMMKPASYVSQTAAGSKQNADLRALKLHRSNSRLADFTLNVVMVN